MSPLPKAASDGASTLASGDPAAGRLGAVVISASNFKRDHRALKLAKTLGEAGYAVTCVGMVTDAADELVEDLGFAMLRRVVTSSVPYRAELVGGGAARAGDGAALDAHGAAHRGDGRRQTGDRVRPPSGWIARLRPGLPSWGSARGLMLTASRLQPVDDLRHFFGRVRENLLFYRAVRSVRCDVVLVCNPVALLAGVLLRARSRAALVYDVREVWTEQALDTSRLYRWLYRGLERVLLRWVDAITAVNDLVGRDLAARHDLDVPPVSVLNGASECIAPRLEVSQPLRLLFQGRFAADRGLVPLIRSIGPLRGSATLTLQGFGGVEVELRRTVVSLGLEDVVSFVEPCAPEEVARAAAGYDVGVIPYQPTTLNLLYSSPNKLFDYLGGGLAVASTDIPFCRRLIERYRCGMLFDAADPDAVAEALLGLARDPRAVAEMKANAAAACSATSWATQERVLLDLIATTERR